MTPEGLWPVHPKPLSDELFSSWLIQVAKGNGLKLQAFCDCAFGKDRQLWNRDIDRLAPRWLVRELSLHTAVPAHFVRETTLLAYQGRLFRDRQRSGQLKWILPLMMFHRKRLGCGVQFCPQCLKEDSVPYFRKKWRVAFCTFCVKHGCMLNQRCPKCLAPIAFHRGELGRPNVLDPGLMCLCSECGFDFRLTPVQEALIFEGESFGRVRELLTELERPQNPKNRFLRLAYTDVLHQLCKLLVSQRSNLQFYRFVTAQSRIGSQLLAEGRFTFEERELDERHHIVQLATWLMMDLRVRLHQAWKAGAVRYNLLLKDMHDPPRRFATMVAPLNRLS